MSYALRCRRWRTVNSRESGGGDAAYTRLMSASTEAFRDLHRSGTFIIPNPYDTGSARLLETLGFSALATTSAGFAATLGQLDMTVTRTQLVDHIASLTSATTVPLNVDAERCFAATAANIAETVEMFATAGAAGFSIEDWDPVAGRIDDLETARSRMLAASEAAHASGMVVTARCENHLHDVQDLDNTVLRLQAYVDAGADAIYAPGLAQPADIARVVAIGVPVNVLLLPGGLTVAQLADLGVRRVSVGGLLAWAALGAVAAAAQSLLAVGQFDSTTPFLPSPLRNRALAPRSVRA